MKTKVSTRILAFVLVLALAVPMLVFSVSAEDTVITFNLGANGSASHTDGSSAKTDYTETVDGYTLSITNGSKMYPGSRDAKGNGGLKFGTSSAVGSCQFTVPDDVTSVVLYVAKYKSNTTKISVNGTAYTLTKASNNGEYDAITVDTTTNKTVKFETVTGGVRAMLNTIEFVIPATGEPSISIAGDNVLQVGKPVTLTANLTNIEGDVAWASSDDSIATVEGGVVTGVKMGTATITASIGEVQQTKDVTVYPAEGVITVAEAIEIIEFAGTNAIPYEYTVIGIIESIDTKYNADDDNITVTISDETGSIKAYKMKGGKNLLVGQKIEVTGKLKDYNGTIEFEYPKEYKLILDESLKATIEDLEALELKMSLGYTYETSTELVAKPSVSEATLSFADKANRAEQTADKQVWLQNGITLTNDKAGSTTNVADYAAPARFYKSSTITIEAVGNITEIVFDCNSAAYATDLQKSIGGTATASDDKVTVKLDGTATSFTVALGAQVRLDSLTVTTASGEAEGDELVETEVYKNSNFAFRFAVDAALMDIENVDARGIKISAGGKDVYFAAGAGSWTVADGLCYITVELGDIINNLARLDTVFTMQAYVEVEGVKYAAENEKAYSVVDMIAYYCDNLGIEEVTHLYDYLANNNLI